MNAIKESFFYNILSSFLFFFEKLIEIFHKKIYKKDESKTSAYDSLIYKLVNKLCAPFEKWWIFLHNSRQNSKFLHEKSILSLILNKIEIILIIIPFNYLFIDYILRNVSSLQGISSIWDELVLLLTYLYVFFRGLWSDKKYNFRLNILDIVAVFFILMGISIALINSPDKQVTIEGFRAVYQYILWYFPLRILLDKENRIYALRSILITGLFLGAHSCYQFAMKVPMPANWVDSTETITTRAFSIIGSPNILGAVFVLLTPICMSIFYCEKNKFFKYLSLVAIPLMLMGILVTFARQAYLAIFGGFFIFFVLFYPSIIKYLIILVGIVMVAFPSVADRILYLFTPTYFIKSSRGGRMLRYAYAFKEWFKAPILGKGFGRFGGAVATNNNLTPFYVDSYYLKTLVEIGVVGLASMIFTFLYILNYIKKILVSQKTKETMIMVSGIFIGALGIFFQNFVENVFEVPLMVVLYWSIIAICLTYDD